MNEVPKKLLKIEDLTFILPDDFHGNLKDAINILSDYINSKFIPDNSPHIKEMTEEEEISLINLQKSNFLKKASMQFNFLVLNEYTGEYEKKKDIPNPDG